MDTLLGSTVIAHLTHNNIQVSGLVIKVDEENIYLQSKASAVHIIPKKNVIYYTTDKLSESKIVLTKQEEVVTPPSSIKVFINGEFFVEIPVPPTVDLTTANEKVLKSVWGNPDVQTILRGRVQKSVEYSLGEMNIVISDVAQNATDTDDNSFSIGANPVNAYLSPLEMANKLSNIVKKGNQNER